MSSFPFFLLLLCSSVLAQAAVPASKTFKYVNTGGYGEYTDEYDSNYRLLGDLQAPNFAICFYNTTPSAYTLAIRMGSRPEDSTSNIMRWVWSANRGNPVGEKSTLTFGTNGNLVLAHADGRIAWETGTANKGVVGLELLSTGNLVLVDKRRRFVWQSFDYPTDTLMVGQGLQKGGVSQLVSRVSNSDGSNGRYSLVLEKERLALYLKSKNSPNPILYYTASNFQGSIVDRVVLGSAPAFDEGIYSLSYDFFLDNSKSPASVRLARPKYNSTLSFIRVESDGNIRMYTYKDNAIFGAWETTYTLFNRDGTRSVSECKLPTKCGSLGVCQNNQCVGCPTPKGLLAWSEACAPPKLAACKKGVPNKVSYYKVVGVEHFTSDYTEGDGPVKVNVCRGKCDTDCGCLGFFYREESSKCLLAYELGALSRVSNQSHVAYIKTSK